MKKIKPLLCVLLLGVMSSCSNNESAYNEKATALFLDEMKKIDDVQKTFADSNVVLHPDAGETISLTTKAENTEENAQRDVQNMNDLKPSEAAKEFHAGVVFYFTKIKNYGTTAKQLMAATADKKQELYDHLMNQYKELNEMPNEVLETQKQYFSKAGLKAQQ